MSLLGKRKETSSTTDETDTVNTIQNKRLNQLLQRTGILSNSLRQLQSTTEFNTLFVPNPNGYYQLVGIGPADSPGLLIQQCHIDKTPIVYSIFLKGEDLHVNGQAHASSFLQEDSTYVSSVANPAFGMKNYNSPTASGLYQSDDTVGQVSMSIAGNQTAIFDYASFESLQPVRSYSLSGSSTNPNFATSPSSGLYRASLEGDVALSCQNQTKLYISPSATTSANRLYLPSGGASTPGLTFNESGGDTGGVGFSAGQLILSAQGNVILSLGTNLITSTRRLLLPSGGTQTNPTLSFNDSNQLGIYGTAGSLNLTVNGTQQMAVTATETSIMRPLRLENGSVSTPSFSFINDSNSGLFRIAEDTVGITCGGVNRLTLSTSGLTIGASSNSVQTIRFGRTAGASAGTITVSFGITFGSTPTVVVSSERTDIGYVFHHNLISVSTTGFTYRYYFSTITAPSALYNSGSSDGHVMHWIAIA